MTLVCVLWLALVAFVNLLNESIPSAYMVVFLGVAVMVLFGLRYSVLYAAMLYRPNGIHLVDLFRDEVAVPICKEAREAGKGGQLGGDWSCPFLRMGKSTPLSSPSCWIKL